MRSLFAAVTPELLMLLVSVIFNKCVSMVFFYVWSGYVAMVWIDLLMCYNECVVIVWFGFPKCGFYNVSIADSVYYNKFCIVYL